jgi:hypothetical protein
VDEAIQARKTLHFQIEMPPKQATAGQFAKIVKSGMAAAETSCISK